MVLLLLMKDNYDLFISYRRDGGSEIAKLLRDLFVRDGYIVFFDEDANAIGELGGILEESIRKSRLVILVISKGCFDRIIEGDVSEEDNYWREVCCAVREKGGECIIPVLTPDAQSTKDLPEVNEELKTIKRLRYIRYKGELGNLMGGFYNDLKGCIETGNVKKTGVRAIYFALVALALLAGLGLWWWSYGGANEDSEPTIVAPEVAYKEAIRMMTSDNRDTFMTGYQMMDSLSNTNYLPAMYEIVRTLGWNSNDTSVHRKKMLDIKCDKANVPTDTIATHKVVKLSNQILALDDSSYADIKIQVALLMCAYHNDKRFGICDDKMAWHYLDEAKQWSALTEDSYYKAKIAEAEKMISKH